MLQSSRLWKREKFQDGRYLAEKAHLRFLSSYFHQGNLTASREIRKGGFLFCSDCRAAKLVGRVIPNASPTRNKDKPNPCEVKRNTGKGNSKMTSDERRKILLENIAKIDVASERYYGEEDRKILEELKREGLVSCEATPGKLNWFTIYPNVDSKC